MPFLDPHSGRDVTLLDREGDRHLLGSLGCSPRALTDWCLSFLGTEGAPLPCAAQQSQAHPHLTLALRNEIERDSPHSEEHVTCV